MKEDFLHYLWRFRKFPQAGLKTTRNEPITVIHPGHYLQLSGPDFFNSQVIIANQKWAGNIETHIKSSDWYVHRHENDPAYENVILHVVWEHDAAVFRKDNSEIPVLELKNIISGEMLAGYQSLLAQKSWIYCERQLGSVDDFIWKNWIERLFFERLEKKVKPIEELLRQTSFDWEAVLFCMLARNFGLNSNGPSFFSMAQSIPFSIIRKERFELENLEALFFGLVGLLDTDSEDAYFGDLQFRFQYLSHKFRLESKVASGVEFFKHRPDNFPTIRIAQFAQLYHKRQHLFSEIISADSVQAIYGIFNFGVSDYWQTHYLFDRESPRKKKMLTRSFIDLLIVNTIVPIGFEYAKSQGKEMPEILLSIVHEIAAEKNAVLDKFCSFGIKSGNAYQSQALLQLKNDYCDRSRCLECAIGIELLK